MHLIGSMTARRDVRAAVVGLAAIWMVPMASAVDGPQAGSRPFEYQPARVPFYDPGSKRWGVTVEPLTEMQKPLPPEDSRRHAVTPAGFRVELFAAEPLLQGKPLALCFDADGGVLVAESVDYPNDLVEPGQGAGRDRIVRLVDADGDGSADRREVFVEGLSIPTSMLAHDGGLIVAQAPDMLFLKDTDGDGRADARTVLFSGWGTSDTHAGPSNLTWGLDGWIYGIVGYAGFKGRVGDEELGFPAGFFRFLPDGSRLEYLRSTNNNSWGFGFSEEGLVFGSTANGNPSEHMPLANRVYERVRGWSARRLEGIAGSPALELAPRAGGPNGRAPIRQVDHHGRFTAAAGHRIYTARAYPREYWNRTAFVCEPTGHVVATFELAARGAGFASRMAWNLVASDDEWTAPIAAEVGPDGQVWVVDWYNFIVQHNPTPAGFETGRRGAYVTPLRDKTHGRIWRVVHGTPPTVARGPLAAASGTQLVALLGDDNLFWRSRGQRRLVERGMERPDGGRDVVPALLDRVAETGVDAVGLNPGAIHAIWTLRLLGALAGPAADPLAVAHVHSALAHPSAGVRLNAVKALPRDAATLAALVASGAATDPTPLVRLAVLEALGECLPTAEAGRLVAMLVADSDTLSDPILADAATAAERAAAAEQFMRLRPTDPAAIDELVRRIDGRIDPDVATGLIVALGTTTASEAAAALLDRLPGMTPLLRAAAVRTLLANRAWSALVVDRLEQGTTSLGDIPLSERTKLTEHPDRRVRDRARKVIAAGGGMPSADRQRVIDEVLPLVQAGGDAANGKRVFQQHCGSCHVHGGVGGRVGPDLTGMSVHPARELLVHILDPNRSVEGNYRAYSVVTTDGRVVTGLLAGESRTALEILDGQGMRIVIQRDEIDELRPSLNSLMPVGFERQIRPADFADLLAFLTHRGG